jgi:hypothetical protein
MFIQSVPHHRQESNWQHQVRTEKVDYIHWYTMADHTPLNTHEQTDQEIFFKNYLVILKHFDLYNRTV